MTRISITGLIPDTEYAYRIRARAGVFASEWSQLSVFTTIADAIAPNIPTGFTWVVVGNAFHGEWDAVTQNVNGEDIAITRYELELTANATTKIVAVPPTTDDKVKYDLSYEANRALFGAPFPSVAARVRSVDNKELKSAWTSLITVANAVPSEPTSITATAGVDRIDVVWTVSPSNDVVGYELHVGTSAGFTPNSGNKVFSGSALNYTYFTATAVDHYFKVCAVDEFEQKSTYAVSTGVTPTAPAGPDTTPPSVPTGLAATITANANGVGATAAVSWTAVGASDLNGYVLRYRRNGSGDNWVEITTSDDTTSVLAPLNAIHTSYDFQVRAFDFSANFSAWSSVVTASGGSNAAPANIASLSSTKTWDAITYSWTAVADTDIKNYEVTFSTHATFASGNTTFYTGEATTLTVSGLIPTTLYYARVRAVDTGGLTSAAWSSTNTTTTEFQSGTLSASGPITLGPNANMVLNGGEIRSNTYTYPGQSGSTYIYHAGATAGFYLGNDGLVIAQGSVHAEAFSGGTFTAGDIIIGAGGAIKSQTYDGTTTGWWLGEDGLHILDGTIEAAALKIQSGRNILRPEHASFQLPASYYTDTTVLTNAVLGDVSTTPKYGTKSINVLRGASTAVFSWRLASTTTDYNIPVEANQVYRFSAWIRNRGAVSTPVSMSVKWSNGTETVVWTSTPATSTATWVRVTNSSAITAPAGVTGAHIVFSSSATASGAGFDVDAVQVEAQTAAFSAGASPWAMPGITTITGNLIKTGAIQSTEVAWVWDPVNLEYVSHPDGLPAWYIDVDGTASFGRTLVTGNMVVGQTSDAADSLAIVVSSNYVHGSSGWIIRGDGYAEFRQLEADSIDGDAIQANTLDVDTLKSGDLNANIALLGGIVVTNPTTFAQVGMSYDKGFFVYGASPDGGVTQGPTYISFPVDGAPNIISGILKAVTLEVSGAGTELSPGASAAFFQNSTINPYSKFTLLDQAAASASPPVAGPSYSLKSIDDTGLGSLKGSLTYHAATSSYYGVYYSGSSVWTIRQFNHAGTLTNTITLNPNSGIWRFAAIYGVAVVSSVLYILTMQYDIANTGVRCLTISRVPASGNLDAYIMLANDTTLAYQSYVRTFGVTDGLGGTNHFITGSFTDVEGGAPATFTTYQVKTYSTTQLAGGSPPAPASAAAAAIATYTTTNSMMVGADVTAPALTGIWAGSADWGSARVIISNKNNTNDHFVYSISGGSLIVASDDIFPVGTAAVVGVTYPGQSGTFEGFSTGTMSQVGGKRGIIQHSTINWGAGTTARWGVSQTRYDATGPYQSMMSQIAYFTMVKRAYLSVTTDSGSAPAARVYVGRKSTDTQVLTDQFYQSPTAGPGVTVNAFSAITFSGTNPPASSTFPAAGANGGKIVSAATDSLIDATLSDSTIIRADGYARFKSPIMYSALIRNTTAPTTGSAQETALRIGTPSGAHTRYGPNKIQGMSGDTSAAAVTINKIDVPGSFHGGTYSRQGPAGTGWSGGLAGTGSTVGQAITVNADGFLHGWISMTGYTPTAASAGSIVCYFNGTVVASGNSATTPNSYNSFFFNTANEHTTFPTVFFRVAVTAGTNYIDPRIFATTDANDYLQVQWIVLPN